MHYERRKIIGSFCRAKYESLGRPCIRQFRRRGDRTWSHRFLRSGRRCGWWKINRGSGCGDCLCLVGCAGMSRRKQRDSDNANYDGSNGQQFLSRDLVRRGCGIPKLGRHPCRRFRRRLIARRVVGNAGYVRLCRLKRILFVRFVGHGEPLCGNPQLDLDCRDMQAG